MVTPGTDKRESWPGIGGRAPPVLLILAALLALLPGTIWAQGPDDLRELSLEELLNLEVTVPSKAGESIVRSPAIVSAISMDDLRTFGVRTHKADANHATVAIQSEAAAVKELSAYGQLDWSWSKLRAVAGVRFMENELAGSHFSQRFYSSRAGVGSQLLTTIAYSYERPSFGFFLNVANLLDRVHEDPDMNQDLVPVVPGGPGRSFNAGVKFRF